jgi:hypothetical protein
MGEGGGRGQTIMKKVTYSIAVALCCGLLTSCGFGTTGTATTDNSQQTVGAGDILGAILTNSTGGSTAASTGNVLGDIISVFAGDILTNKNFLVGTWNYQKPCVQFESENLLAKAGGSIVSNKVEATLESYYQKVGIKPGACKFVFNKDNSLQYTIGSKTYKGSYTFDSNKKTLTITTALGNQVTAYVSIAGTTMGLTFDASKLLTLVNSASAVSSSLSSISAIASNYSGMKLGFEFSK